MILPMLEVDCNRNEGLTIKIKPVTLGMASGSALGHLRAANKELLLALRSVIDSAIEYTEQKESGARPARRIQVRVGEAPTEETPEQQ
jgi:hypothetical protein